MKSINTLNMVEKAKTGNSKIRVDTPKRTNKKINKHLIIGVTGGTASGKTSLCHRIGEGLKQNLCIVSLDSFYKGLT